MNFPWPLNIHIYKPEKHFICVLLPLQDITRISCVQNPLHLILYIKYCAYLNIYLITRMFEQQAKNLDANKPVRMINNGLHND